MKIISQGRAAKTNTKVLFFFHLHSSVFEWFESRLGWAFFWFGNRLIANRLLFSAPNSALYCIPNSHWPFPSRSWTRELSWVENLSSTRSTTHIFDNLTSLLITTSRYASSRLAQISNVTRKFMCSESRKLLSASACTWTFEVLKLNVEASVPARCH